VSVIEASWDGRSSNYAADPNHPEFAGKNFTNYSGAPSASIHATEVGKHLFGLTTSMAPGITQIDNYYSRDWRRQLLFF
jgi:hypothetical protein